METYLFFVIILFVLATSDLIVGVANDAVNFLNSSLGSKVAPRHIILLVASFGVVVGTLFSSGMMEVARSGFFKPEMFRLQEVMVIFLAVMFTDILLLDFYNTFGLPTSTTVSLVSSLLGGSVIISLVKIHQAGQPFEEIGNYINTGRALGIFSAILLSVVISFIAGSIVQYISRLIFTFNYEKTIKRYGAVWGSLALTALTYFIIIKGAKGTTFLTEEMIDWISNNSLTVIGFSILFWTIILQLLLWFTKINILKPIVLIGTFALALAFAANDLVNFIGVPLAGLSSYMIGLNMSDPLTATMEALREPVSTNTLILIASGLLMVGTLWFNKKARTVSKTEINLSRQFEGFEKFESSPLARTIVRVFINIGNGLKWIIPNSLYKKMQNRFQTAKVDYSKTEKKDRPAFDFVRATVNLMVASSLISIGTALKLPLSTTYVTFMVAMSTSFADKAWGRESAVYRVNGVLTVIAGWFFTAFLAFTSTSIIALSILFGGIPATLLILGLVGLSIYRTNILHKTNEKKTSKKESVTAINSKISFIDSLITDLKTFISLTEKIYKDIYNGLMEEHRKKLKKSLKISDELVEQSEFIVSKILQGTMFMEEADLKDELNFSKAISAVKDISYSVSEMAKLSYQHVDNNHSGLSKEQQEDFRQLRDLILSQLDMAATRFSKKDISKVEDIHDRVKELKKSIKKLDKNQINRIKNGTTKIRTNLLFLNLIFKSEHISDNITEIMNFNRELVKSKKQL